MFKNNFNNKRLKIICDMTSFKQFFFLLNNGYISLDFTMNVNISFSDKALNTKDLMTLVKINDVKCLHSKLKL